MIKLKKEFAENFKGYVNGNPHQEITFCKSGQRIQFILSNPADGKNETHTKLIQSLVYEFEAHNVPFVRGCEFITLENGTHITMSQFIDMVIDNSEYASILVWDSKINRLTLRGDNFTDYTFTKDGITCSFKVLEPKLGGSTVEDIVSFHTTHIPWVYFRKDRHGNVKCYKQSLKSFLAKQSSISSETCKNPQDELFYTSIFACGGKAFKPEYIEDGQKLDPDIYRYYDGMKTTDGYSVIDGRGTVVMTIDDVCKFITDHLVELQRID